MSLDPLYEVEESVCIETIAFYEGHTIEEAALSYATRKRLPGTAFCGPNRSYPAHDAKRVRSGLQRLSQFGGRLKPATRIAIARCLIRRAKRMGVEVTDVVRKKLTKSPKKKVSESVENQVIDWYMTEIYPVVKKEYQGE